MGPDFRRVTEHVFFAVTQACSLPCLRQTTSLPHESGYKPELRHRAPAKLAFLVQGENHADRCSFARLALSFGSSAMQLRDVLYNREAQSRSAQLAAPCFVNPIETLEDARQIALANSD